MLEHGFGVVRPTGPGVWITLPFIDDAFSFFVGLCLNFIQA